MILRMMPRACWRGFARQPLFTKLTMSAAAGALVLASWPGLFERVFFGLPSGIFVLPVALFWGIWILVRGSKDWVDLLHRDFSLVRRGGFSAMFVMLLTCSLLWLHVPQRISLLVCWWDFARRANQPAANAESSMTIGVFRVQKIVEDPRGGIFYLVHTMPALGDSISFGFAYQPNRLGTPFGNDRYRLHHLFGDWHSFSACDDF